MQSLDKVASNEPSVISRPRLLNLFQQMPPPPIVLIVAPAGYGKSTLASQWMESRSSPTFRFALTSEHNTPDRFLRGLFAAIGVQCGNNASLDSMLDTIKCKAETIPDGALVIDDYHIIENPEVHQIMSILISSMPAGPQLLIVSRTTPPLPLARRRMAGDVLDLSMPDLSFTEDEVAELVASDSCAAHLNMDIGELTTVTDGWIAGIRLAMVSAETQHRHGVSTIAEPLSVHQSLDEFMIEEILASLSAELGEFILCTAFLPYLDPDLCDFVLQTDRSSALIAEAGQKLAFIQREHDASALTYHSLFAESANRIAHRHYSSAVRRQWYDRATSWFEQKGMWEEALEQSILAQDWEAALRLMKVVCKDLRNQDLAASRLYWLRKIPVEQLLKNGDLARWYTSALLESGHITDAYQALALVMPGWSTSDNPQLQSYFHASMAFISILKGDDGAALRHLYTGLSYQPMDNHVERLHYWSAVMSQEFYRGNDIAAEQAYLQVQHCRQHLPAEQGWIFIHVNLQKPNYSAIRGDLASAASQYTAHTDRLPAVFRHSLPHIQARLAAIYLERNELKTALALAIEVQRGLDIYPQQIWHTEAWLIVARVHHALNDRAGAQKAINRARLIQEKGGGLTLLQKIMATENWLMFDEHRHSILAGSASGIDINKPWRMAFFGELDPRLVEIGRLIHLGNASDVIEGLQKLIDNSIDSKRWSEVVQLATWQVVASLETGDTDGAREALTLALQHGRPGRFVRSFHTPGYDLVPYLRSVLPEMQDEDAAYIDKLILSGIWSTSKNIESRPGFQVQTPLLTKQEQNVLELLAVGSSNKVIGEQLFITVRTVKKHVSNILYKLQVPNRTSAVARARELEIIS